MDKLIPLLKQGKFRAAENLLRRQLADSPEDSYLLTQLANVLWNRGKYDEALKVADEAKEKSPADPLLLFTRARILWTMQEYELSVAEWDAILSMDSAEIAEKGFGKSWAKSVINDARFYKADCLFHLYRDAEALPLMAEHLRNRGRGIESDFSKKDAVEFYNKLKFSSKNGKKAPAEIGFATEKQSKRIEKRLAELAQTGDFEKTVRYLKTICRHYPAEYYYKTLLSEYCALLCQTEDCLRFAREAFDAEPTDPLVKYNFANALKINGFFAEALAQFEELLGFGADFIAYSQHGEGMAWTKKLMRDARRMIQEIKI